MGGQQTRPESGADDMQIQIFNNIQDSPIHMTSEVPYNFNDTMDGKLRKVWNELLRRIDTINTRSTENVSELKQAIIDFCKEYINEHSLRSTDCSLRSSKLENEIEYIRSDVKDLIKRINAVSKGLSHNLDVLRGTVERNAQMQAKLRNDFEFEKSEIEFVKREYKLLLTSIAINPDICESDADKTETPTNNTKFTRDDWVRIHGVLTTVKSRTGYTVEHTDVMSFLKLIGYIQRVAAGTGAKSRGWRYKLTQSASPDDIIICMDNMSDDTSFGKSLLFSKKFVDAKIVPYFEGIAKLSAEMGGGAQK